MLDQRNFLLTSEGLNSWVAFTSIDYDDFTQISKNAFHNTPSFSISVLKQERLFALKFWIEDMIRMNKLPHAAARFTPQVMVEYIKLYDTFVRAKYSSIEFVN